MAKKKKEDDGKVGIVLLRETRGIGDGLPGTRGRVSPARAKRWCEEGRCKLDDGEEIRDPEPDPSEGEGSGEGGEGSSETNEGGDGDPGGGQGSDDDPDGKDQL